MNLFHSALGYWFLALIVLFVITLIMYGIALWPVKSATKDTKGLIHNSPQDLHSSKDG